MYFISRLTHTCKKIFSELRGTRFIFRHTPELLLQIFLATLSPRNKKKRCSLALLAFRHRFLNEMHTLLFPRFIANIQMVRFVSTHTLYRYPENTCEHFHPHARQQHFFSLPSTLTAKTRRAYMNLDAVRCSALECWFNE